MKNSPVQSHVLRLAHPPIPTVHIGIIGLGNRGLLTLQRYLQIEGVEMAQSETLGDCVKILIFAS